jgi:CRISPR system Cascade subunit CasA
MQSRLLFFIAGSALLAGCKSYSPHPVDLTQELRRWQESPATPAAGSLALTLEQAKTLALTLNPDLNLKRLEHAKTLAGARAAGWWKDPGLDADALHILKSVPNPWILGTGLQFTIPVTGIPGLERLAATQMAEADRLAVLAAERQVLAEVEQAWIRLAHQGHKLQAADAFLKRLDATCTKLEELQKRGELSLIDLGVFQLERQTRRLERQRLAASQREQHLTLLGLIGLAPIAKVTLATAEPEIVIPAKIDPAALVNHPRLRLRQARLDAAEAALRTEIRRQYPELRLGPSLGYEDGEGRLGIGAGLDLPLWNRNRQAIAEAEGARAVARGELLAEHRALCQEAARLEARLVSAQEETATLRRQLLPEASEHLEQAMRLVARGEADVLVLSGSVARVFEAEQQACDAEAETDVTAAALRALAE